MSQTDNPGNKPWNDNTSEEWLTEVESWRWENDAENKLWRKSGFCKYCNHYMVKTIPYPVVGPFYEGPLTEESAIEKIEIKEVGISCNCSHDHPGRPSGKSGCGHAGVFSPPNV